MIRLFAIEHFEDRGESRTLTNNVHAYSAWRLKISLEMRASGPIPTQMPSANLSTVTGV